MTEEEMLVKAVAGMMQDLIGRPEFKERMVEVQRVLLGYSVEEWKELEAATN